MDQFITNLLLLQLLASILPTWTCSCEPPKARPIDVGSCFLCESSFEEQLSLTESSTTNWACLTATCLKPSCFEGEKSLPIMEPSDAACSSCGTSRTASAEYGVRMLSYILQSTIGEQVNASDDVLTLAARISYTNLNNRTPQSYPGTAVYGITVTECYPTTAFNTIDWIRTATATLHKHKISFVLSTKTAPKHAIFRPQTFPHLAPKKLLTKRPIDIIPYRLDTVTANIHLTLSLIHI